MRNGWTPCRCWRYSDPCLAPPAFFNFAFLQDGKIDQGVRRLAELRSKWSTRPDRLIRAARHYEAAAQIFTRRTVMDSVRRYIQPIRDTASKLSTGDHRRFNEKEGHKVEAAARIDWSGGWSDTPPITYENGGAVLNIAIMIDGKVRVQLSYLYVMQRGV